MRGAVAVVQRAGFVEEIRVGSHPAVVPDLGVEVMRMMVLVVVVMMLALVLLPRPHLLQLHPPVLEPDLDLALGEAESPGDVGAPVPREVHVVEEFLL